MQAPPRRAERVRTDPDLIQNHVTLVLIGGMSEMSLRS